MGKREAHMKLQLQNTEGKPIGRPSHRQEDNIATCRGFAWFTRRVLDWMIGFIDTLYIALGTTGNYSAIAILHTCQFTVPNALEFLVFTSRIQATDLSQSHCNVKSHMKSSCHSLIHFLPLFCSCQFRRLNSIQFLISRQAGVPKLDSVLLDYSFSSAEHFLSTDPTGRCVCWSVA
jgi:hypothetical protein